MTRISLAFLLVLFASAAQSFAGTLQLLKLETQLSRSEFKGVAKYNAVPGDAEVAPQAALLRVLGDFDETALPFVMAATDGTLSIILNCDDEKRRDAQNTPLIEISQQRNAAAERARFEVKFRSKREADAFRARVGSALQAYLIAQDGVAGAAPNYRVFSTRRNRLLFVFP